MAFLVQIESDSLTKTARENWAGETSAAYKPELVASIYATELHGGKPQPPKLRRIMLLEISQYLENYLIPHFSEVSMLSIAQPNLHPIHSQDLHSLFPEVHGGTSLGIRCRSLIIK